MKQEALASRWQDLYMFLKNKGYEVYGPGQHKGDTLSAYIVVKNEAVEEANKFTSQAIYSILLYTPEAQYSLHEPFVNDVLNTMLELRPVFERYSTQESPVYDEASKGWYTRVYYSNFRKKLLRPANAASFVKLEVKRDGGA